MESMFNDHHGTPAAFLTNFKKIVKLTETRVACHCRRWNSFSFDYFEMSRSLLESGFPARYFWRNMLDCTHCEPRVVKSIHSLHCEQYYSFIVQYRPSLVQCSAVFFFFFLYCAETSGEYTRTFVVSSHMWQTWDSMHTNRLNIYKFKRLMYIIKNWWVNPWWLS